MIPPLPLGSAPMAGYLGHSLGRDGHADTTDRHFDSPGQCSARCASSGAARVPEAIGDRRREQRFDFVFQGRYLYQSWDIEVPFERRGRLSKGELAAGGRLPPQHERIYTIKDDNDIVEFTTWKVRAIGDTGGMSRRGEPLPP